MRLLFYSNICQKYVKIPDFFLVHRRFLHFKLKFSGN